MRSGLLALAIAALLTLPASAQPAGEPAGPTPPVVPDSARQLVLVETADWTATEGSLQRYERSGPDAPWQAVGEAVPVVTGRAGLGWGRGLHAPEAALPDEPVKREGDRRAPAGAFDLTAAFGYAESGETGLPYLQAREGTECVDDAASRFYNQIVQRQRIPTPDWSSHENMRRADVLYRRGVVVAHNAEPAEPGAGSCIFLHVWRGPGSTTIGCTAMPEADLAGVIAWLQASAHPVLVQLPASVRSRVAEGWGLPVSR